MSTATRLLACGCVKTYDTAPPKIGDDVLCSRCGETRVITPRYVVRCISCNRFRRSFGDLMALTAETVASSHAVRKRHVVEVRKDDVLVFTAGKNTHQLTINDIPPF